MRLMTLFAAAASFALLLTITPGVQAADCFNCNNKESKDKCSGADQCRGTRDECQKAGCKITGTASCSTSANVKICLSNELEPYQERLDITLADPSLAACFAPSC